MSMRLAIAIVFLAFAPAFAQNSEAPTPMRPSIRADGPGAPRATPAPTTPAPATPPVPAFSPIPPPPRAEQCRTACAQTYYFCLAENEVSDCAPAWSQCRLQCNATAATTPGR